MSVFLLIQPLQSCPTIGSSEVIQCIVMQDASDRLEDFISLH